MSHPAKKLLGKHLIKLSTGRQELTDDLSGNILALFFTDAQSSGGVGTPNFTSRVIDFHTEITKKEPGCLDVIQIPLEEQLDKKSTVSFRNLPFFAIHGENSQSIQEYLIRKYSVHRSTVILIDSTSGHVINFQGKEKISLDPKGAHFPWTYPTCKDILASGHLITSTTSNQKQRCQGDGSRFGGGVTGLYFAAYWCPPCRTFAQALEDVYKKINKKKVQFQVIFISSDRSKESFDRFFSTQPWSAIPFEDVQDREDLTAMYNVQGIPSLVILDNDYNVITLDGRSEVNDDIDGIDFPWYPKPVEELRDKHSTILNHTLCLIYFIGNDDLEYEKAESALMPIALEFLESDIEEALQPKFFIATDVLCEVSESLRIFMDLDESKSYIVTIHNSRYAVANMGQTGQTQTQSESCIRDFLRKFQTFSPELKYRYISSKFI